MESINWCLKCGKITDMIRVRTGLPGISAKRCALCNSGIQVNHLEDSSAMIPKDLISIPDNYCPHCNDITTFSNINILAKYGNEKSSEYRASECVRCGSYIVDFGNEFVFFDSDTKYDHITKIIQYT